MLGSDQVQLSGCPSEYQSWKGSQEVEGKRMPYNKNLKINLFLYIFSWLPLARLYQRALDGM